MAEQVMLDTASLMGFRMESNARVVAGQAVAMDATQEALLSVKTGLKRGDKGGSITEPAEPPAPAPAEPPAPGP